MEWVRVGLRESVQTDCELVLGGIWKFDAPLLAEVDNFLRSRMKLIAGVALSLHVYSNA